MLAHIAIAGSYLVVLLGTGGILHRFTRNEKRKAADLAAAMRSNRKEIK